MTLVPQLTYMDRHGQAELIMAPPNTPPLHPKGTRLVFFFLVMVGIPITASIVASVLGSNKHLVTE